MKKTLVRVLTFAVLSAILVFSLASCSSFGKIEKNFTDAEYELVTDENETLNKITAELEDVEISVTAHVFKKDLLNYAIVLEFGSKGDLEKAIGDSDTLKGFISDIQKSDLVRDNCVLIPLGLEASNMTEIFNK